MKPRWMVGAWMVVLMACSSSSSPTSVNEQDDEVEGLEIEVILRETRSLRSYSGAVPSRSMGVPSQAFGATSTNHAEWITWTAQDIEDFFTGWVAANPDLAGWRPDFVSLNFEKDFVWVEEENWPGVTHAVAAVRKVLGPDVEIGMHGAPFPIRVGTDPSRTYTPEVIAFFQSLDIAAVPVFYIKATEGEEWIAPIEEQTRTTLAVAQQMAGNDVFPVMWHLRDGPGVSARSAPPLLQFDPDLSQTLRLQLRIAEDEGVRRVRFWHVEDTQELEDALAAISSLGF